MHLEETVSSEPSETIKPETDAASAISSGEEKSSMKTGIIAEQILEGGTGRSITAIIFRFEPGLGWAPILDAASGGYDRCACSADGLA